MKILNQAVTKHKSVSVAYEKGTKTETANPVCVQHNIFNSTLNIINRMHSSKRHLPSIVWILFDWTIGTLQLVATAQLVEGIPGDHMATN
jgi:hypothetical protein